MSVSHSTTIAHVVAAKLPPDRNARSRMMDDLFESAEIEREMIRKARQSARASQMRRMMRDRFGIHPAALAFVERMKREHPQKRAEIWTLVQILMNDTGLDEDVPADPEEDHGPVYDRTLIARRQGAMGYGPQGERSRRAIGTTAKRTIVNMQMVEEMVRRARDGQPMRRRVGRPSNEERAAMSYAEDRLRHEGFIGILEHKPSDEEDPSSGDGRPN